MKLSVIIPVYNAERYLTKCVDSVLNQTYQDIEVILINDGSTDRSPIICDEFCTKDKRVKVIHKKNEGTSAARNCGLREATGEYVTFIDNDDYWCNRKSIDKIMYFLEKKSVDFVVHEPIEFWEKKEKYKVYNDFIYEKKFFEKGNYFSKVEVLIKHCILGFTVWNKIIKRDLLQEKKIFFPTGMRNEDTYFTGQLIIQAKSCSFYSEKFYVHRMHGDSLSSNQIQYEQLADLKKICISYIRQLALFPDLDNKAKKVLLGYIAYPFCVWMGQSKIVKYDKRVANDTKEMKKYSYVLNFGIDSSVKKIRSFYNIFGYNATAYVISKYIGWKYNGV